MSAVTDVFVQSLAKNFEEALDGAGERADPLP
jgi:hypothetical protein